MKPYITHGVAFIAGTATVILAPWLLDATYIHRRNIWRKRPIVFGSLAFMIQFHRWFWLRCHTCGETFRGRHGVEMEKQIRKHYATHRTQPAPDSWLPPRLMKFKEDA